MRLPCTRCDILESHICETSYLHSLLQLDSKFFRAALLVCHVPWETVDALRVADVDTGTVIQTIFEAEGTLGHSASAHMEEDGSFVLELIMITGFDRTQSRLVLWTAPNTESGHGGYARQAQQVWCWCCCKLHLHACVYFVHTL